MLKMLPALHRVGQSVDYMAANALRELGLTPRQALILITIGRNQPSTNTDVIGKTAIDRSTVTDVVRRLTAKKLITRTRNKRDQRIVDLELTARGVTVCREAEICFADCEAQIRLVIGKSRYRVVGSAIEALAEQIGPVPSAKVSKTGVLDAKLAGAQRA
ncbi:MAG: winged helix DNA-binding protein [Alphaproteobacteria bacterium GM202ARS2]|nr:winged helix DNA-binding protein [Alphaproteobacteria bacterium GM202ARS2]